MFERGINGLYRVSVILIHVYMSIRINANIDNIYIYIYLSICADEVGLDFGAFDAADRKNFYEGSPQFGRGT